MNTLRYGLLLLYLIIFYASANSADDQFLQDSHARFRSEQHQLITVYTNGLKEDKDLLDLEVLLYGAYSLNGESALAQQQFTSLMGISPAQGQVYRKNVSELISLRKDCSQFNQAGPCRLKEAAKQMIIESSHLQHADRFLIAAAINLQDSPYLPTVIDQILKLANAKEVLLKLYSHHPDQGYLELLLSKPFKSTEVLLKILELPPSRLDPWHKLALQENIVLELATAKNPLRFKAYGYYLNNLYLSGFTEIPQHVLNKTQQEILQYDRILQDNNDPTLPLLLATAFLENKDAASAQSILSRSSSAEQSSLQKKLLRAFLKEFLARDLAKEDVYYMYLEGVTKKESLRRYAEQKANKLLFFDSSHAWSNLIGLSPLTDRLIAQYFSEQGYKDLSQIALHAAEPESYSFKSIKIPTFPSLNNKAKFYLELYKSKYERRFQHEYNNSIDKRINALNNSKIKEVEPKAKATRPIKQFTLPPDLPLPVPVENIIQHTFYEGDWYIVYISDAVNPAGENAAGGYWMQKTLKGSHFWGPSIYLGLQQYAPYKILQSPHIPMIQGDLVNLKANSYNLPKTKNIQNEINPENYLVKQDVILQFKWSEISLDQDNDGLNDILELHLGTHPKHPDTDFDGMPDNVDSLPLETFVQSAEQYNPVAMGLLERILGYKIDPTNRDHKARLASMEHAANDSAFLHEQQTVFVQAPAKYFSGIQPPMRLIFLNPEEVEKRKQIASFYPLTLEQIFTNKDATDFYVTWNTRWNGGSFRIRVIDGNIDIESLGNWIGTRH